MCAVSKGTVSLSKCCNNIPDIGKDATKCSLHAAPGLVQQLLLAHKYGMTKIVSDAEVILLEALQYMLSKPTLLIGLRDLLLQIHSAAEQLVVTIELGQSCRTCAYDCSALRPGQRNVHWPASCPLPACSRVAKKTYTFQSQTTEAMRSALINAGKYANMVSRDNNEFVATHLTSIQVALRNAQYVIGVCSLSHSTTKMPVFIMMLCSMCNQVQNAHGHKDCPNLGFWCKCQRVWKSFKS